MVLIAKNNQETLINLANSDREIGTRFSLSKLISVQRNDDIKLQFYLYGLLMCNGGDENIVVNLGLN